MKEIILARDARLALRSQAHHLDPVVLLGANGLTNAVLHEIDRALNDHELIKEKRGTDSKNLPLFYLIGKPNSSRFGGPCPDM